MIKVVFDTNVFISAILFGGNPEVSFSLVKIKKDITFFVSGEIIQEMARILKIKFNISDWRISKLIDNIKNNAILVIPTENISRIIAHNEDNRILECAIEAQADYIVSGDKKHILPLKEFKGIKIVSPKKFLEIFLTKAGN